MFVKDKTGHGELVEASVTDLQERFETRVLTSVEAVEGYVKRIEDLDQSGPTLRSVIEVNPDAVEIARKLDEERAENGPRGPLHGIPVLLKQCIGTADKMSTNCGCLALEGYVAPKDAFIVQKLREAGAVILGKTNMSEWGSFAQRTDVQDGALWEGRRGAHTFLTELLLDPALGVGPLSPQAYAPWQLARKQTEASLDPLL
ncbi:hypothetical protein NDN08_005930 [Rhodosorus marinus]|uniref:Amidase domain-containing protein n=1 Tax=Rhodosorus marinus TaxID=101924 RepID=A0AAV8UJ95_9RHOD|nr:hypothetical protein NDN08_005930 [Rhodosorus marinus]